MKEDRWLQIKQVYSAALECASDKRDEFLRSACGEDDSLRNEVETLLAYQREAEGFMKSPAVDVAAQVLAKDGDERRLKSLIGQSVAHYRIVEKIGEGGMGVVYRAQDTRLGRFVAIKSVPDIFLSDPGRLARLEREAKILAALNHANIATAYGLEESGGKRFLVLELVEGETLAERLKMGRVPLEEALEICRQIAGGLEAAHTKGIVHRDLKPSNIKICPDGKVKILDFGLAKVVEGPRAGDRGSAALPSPTRAETSTESGVILGTAAYMSPEQARGKPVDKRTDVWAFGCILYECLAGRRVFPGETASETLAAVIRDEPVWEALPHDTPEKVRALLRRCLRKDPELRLHDIADARIEVEEARGRVFPSESHGVSRHRRRLAVAGLAAVLAAFVGTGWYLSRYRSARESPVRVVPLVTYPGKPCDPTYSPDGNEIAFSWDGPKQDNAAIYRKPIGPGQLLRLTSSPAPDVRPAWSPDGRTIAFLRPLETTDEYRPDGLCCFGPAWGVFVVPALGGPEKKIAEVNPNASDVGLPCLGLAWSPDSQWLVTTDRCGSDQPGTPQSADLGGSFGLHLLSIGTGEKREVTIPPPGIRGDRGASFSPDGRSLAFVRVLDANRSHILRLFLTNDLRPKGEPELVESVNQRTYGVVWTRDGKEVLYCSGNYASGESFTRRIRISGPKVGSGYPSPPESCGEGATSLAISLDGRRLAYSRYAPDCDIYRFELPAKDGPVKSPEKLITSKRTEYAPDYSPNGQAIAFTSARSGSEEIWICDADGSNQRPLTAMNGPQTGNPRWSPDGKTIVFDSRKEGSADLYLVNSDGSALRRLTSDPGYEGEANWSRDGRWIYYLSGIFGVSAEVCKIPANGGKAIQVTRNGGFFARESPDNLWTYFSKRVRGRGVAIWRLPAGGGKESQVHPGPLSYSYDFVVLAEGIYFTTTRSLQFFDFASGKSETILQDRFFLGLSISPDLSHLLYTRWEPPSSDIMLAENFR